MNGSVGRLYQSVDRIGASYLVLGADKSELLQLSLLHSGTELLMLPQAAAGGEAGADAHPACPSSSCSRARASA
jgi:hypothetical protein